MLIEPIKKHIELVAKYVGSQSNDWLKIKKELVNNLKQEYRHHFSRRHKTSKKQIINDFEKEVMAYWKQITGITLTIDDSLLHKQEDERPPKHWAIFKINEERSRQKREREKKSTIK